MRSMRKEYSKRCLTESLRALPPPLETLPVISGAGSRGARVWRTRSVNSRRQHVRGDPSLSWHNEQSGGLSGTGIEDDDEFVGTSVSIAGVNPDEVLCALADGEGSRGE